jgi:hypothetical protein
VSGGAHAVERWRHNRQVVAPADALVAEVGPLRRRNGALIREVGALVAGSPVVVCSPPPFARRRCRRFASTAGIDIDREYLALPSPGAPAYLIEDAPAATAYFVRSILVPPPGRIWTVPLRLCVSVVSRLPNPGPVVRWLAPRMVVGTRR